MKFKIGNELLKDIEMTGDMDVPVVLMGDNASGKTTIMKNLCGICIPKKGYIEYDEKNAFTYPIPFIKYLKWKRYINSNVLYFESADFLEQKISINENISYYGRLMKADKESVKSYLKKMNFEEAFDKPVSVLSDGSKQKVALSLVFSTDKKIILLDEPEKHLDKISVSELYDILKKMRGKCVLFSSHGTPESLKDFSICKIVRNKEGVIISDNSRTI